MFFFLKVVFVFYKRFELILSRVDDNSVEYVFEEKEHCFLRELLKMISLLVFKRLSVCFFKGRMGRKKRKFRAPTDESNKKSKMIHQTGNNPCLSKTRCDVTLFSLRSFQLEYKLKN